MDTTVFAQRIRQHALEMTSRAGSSHIASVLSMADIIAVLYGSVLHVDPANPRWPERDRFILSKGHAAAGVYAALAERGFFPVATLATHCQNGSALHGHIAHHGVPGVEFSTGSLGHGLPVGAGMAYGAKLDGKSHRVFVVLSDGECDEGSVWEAAMFSGHHRLHNLIAIVDYNKMQSLKTVAETLALEPFRGKWESFGWRVIEVDGHDHAQILQACTPLSHQPAQPLCIIAHTTKGKGVSFMENTVLWHYRSAQGEEYQQAAEELGLPAQGDTP